MKTLLQSLILTFISVGLYAQDIEWEHKFGGEQAEYLYDAIATPDYGFIVVGSSLSDKTGDIAVNQGDFDYFIAKLNEYGEKEWVRNFGGNGTDVLKSIERTFDGGYILAGTSLSEVSGEKTMEKIGQEDIWLLKLNMKGELQWQKTLGGLAREEVSVVKPTSDGGYLIGGSSASDTYISSEKEVTKDQIYKSENSRGNLDYWLVKLNAMGDVLWQKTYGSLYVDQLWDIAEVPGKGYVLGGISDSPASDEKQADSRGYNDWWILFVDEKGTEIWQKTLGSSGDDQLSSLLYTRDEHLLVGGSFSEADQEQGHLKSDFVLTKLDLEGTIVWEKDYNVGQHDFLTNLVYNLDGSILISGYSARDHEKSKKKKPEEGIEDYVVIKTDDEGNELWRKTVGSSQKELLNRCIATRDGGYVLIGTQMPLEPQGSNNADFYLVKLKDRDKPEEVKHPMETFPNPTLEFTEVVLGYEHESGIGEVIDLNGRVLKTFEIGPENSIPLNLGKLPDGMYIIHIKTDTGEDSVKVVKYSN